MRTHTSTDEADLIDLLDRVLDKGLVLEASALIAVAQLDFSHRETRLVLSSLQIHADFASQTTKTCRSHRRIRQRK